MKKIIFLFIFCCKLLHAQHVFVKEWDWRYGGLGFDGLRTFIETTDKGFLCGVSTYSGLGGDKSQENWDLSYETVDYWIIKTDSNGIKQWDKRYGGRQSDYFRYLSQTRDGGYILGGFSNTDKNGDRTESCRGGVDYWIVKIDSLGNKQWDKRFGGTSDDELWEVKQTRDGGYILGGYSYSDSGGDRTQPSRGNQDYWIVKTDSIGNKQWDKRYGGGGSDLLNSLVQSNDGGFVLAGQSSCGIDSGYSTLGHGNMDYWVVKTDSIGNQIWDLSYGGTHFENLNTISKTNDGGYILGGISYSQNNGNKSESN